IRLAMDFEQIYKEYSGKIYRVCLSYINDVDLAKDLTQETFITVWQSLDLFRNEAALGTWIYKIAANKCLRQLEVDKRKSKKDIQIEQPETNEDEKEDKHLFLRQCIAQLPEVERLIIGLYLESVPQEQIATVIGISHNNVRVKIHRIKETLTKKFEEHGAF
ncbi:MAG: RNA polymerase sigma factor, partial [Cyclobacteriaceae bacterium]